MAHCLTHSHRNPQHPQPHADPNDDDEAAAAAAAGAAQMISTTTTHDINHVAGLPADRLTNCDPSTIPSMSDDDAWSQGGHPGQRPCPSAAQTNRTTHPSRSSPRLPHPGKNTVSAWVWVCDREHQRVHVHACARRCWGIKGKRVRPAATKS